MISVEEALKILEDNIPEPRVAQVNLEQAHGCYISEEVVAPEPSPRFTNSAMDGFAVRWADCAKASEAQPVSLRIVGESQAGVPYKQVVGEGSAVRISTGAMLPEGADTVIRVEDTRLSDNLVEICGVKSCGHDVRYSGEEYNEGDVLLQKGCLLRTRELALLAAFGIATVPIFAPPRVALLITGTELAAHESNEIQPHQIRDSNSIMLSTAVKESGAVLVSCEKVEDDRSRTTEAVKQALSSGVDVLLCSGGVSVGRHDHVKEAALAAGFAELFWKIKQKPGKPLFVCRQDRTLLFGLPGNPVSAFMCFNNYVRPVLAQLQGAKSKNRTVTARLKEAVVNRSTRTQFIRVTLKNEPNKMAEIEEMAQQGSHMLSSIVHADGYIIVQPGLVFEVGTLIEVILF